LTATRTDAALLIPVKRFTQAKSRLVEAFPEASRPRMKEQIGIALFDDLVDVLRSFMNRKGDSKFKTIICSPDPSVKAKVKAAGNGFIFLDETTIEQEDPALQGLAGLDRIIAAMNDFATCVLGVKGTVLLMNDLPLLSVHALVGLFKHIQFNNGFKKVLLSPSMGNGCNMIGRFPPNVIETRYSSKHGPSFIEHLTIAKQKAEILGIKTENFIQVYKNLEFYLDLDTPEDLINLYPLLKEVKPRSRLVRLLDGLDIQIEKNDRDDTRHVCLKFNMNDLESASDHE
jgi:2-phospho-L-lactate guanylyltransferase (CobY/MobA/RfbA family)